LFTQRALKLAAVIGVTVPYKEISTLWGGEVPKFDKKDRRSFHGKDSGKDRS
jgi:hypothetical protein